MGGAKPHLKTLGEIERTCVPGPVEVLRAEGTEGVLYAPWHTTGRHRDHNLCLWRAGGGAAGGHAPVQRISRRRRNPGGTRPDAHRGPVGAKEEAGVRGGVVGSAPLLS